MLGSFVNNLPVRARLSSDARVLQWLHEMQTMQQRANARDYVSLTALHQWSDLKGTDTLFDTLMVWLSPQADINAGDIRFIPTDAEMRTAYSLTLSIADLDGGYSLQLMNDGRRTTIAALEDILSHTARAAAALAASSADSRLAQLDGFHGVRTFGALPAAVGSVPVATGASTDALGGRESVQLETLHELLLIEWAGVLGVSDIDLDDDFFELGGDSIKAARLHTRITAATRKAVPLLALFGGATVRAMAATLLLDDWPLHAGITVALKSQGSAPPLFCVASPEVNTIGYAMLARHLTDERPVYVLQAPPDSNSVRRMTPVELPALASKYINALQEVQPEGPYHLVGMCAGAKLGIEMVRQLEAGDIRTAFVGIIDSWAYDTESRLMHLHQVINRIGWYRKRLKELAAQSPRERLQTLRCIGLRRLKNAARVFSGTAPARKEAAKKGITPRESWRRDPGPASYGIERVRVQTPVTVFRRRKQPFWRVRDHTLGWRADAEQIDVIEIVGLLHMNILREPYVQENVKRLEVCLNGAAATEAPAPLGAGERVQSAY